MKTILNFSEFNEIKFGSVHNKTILILNKDTIYTYITIPSTVDFIFHSHGMEFTTADSNKSSIFNIFSNTLTSLKTKVSNLSKRKLILQGLGFKADAVTTNGVKSVSLKLGYSHPIELSLPSFVKHVKVKKDVLLFEASDNILLGNLVNRIYNFKKADSYKAKGFSYPYINKKLKIIKKK